MDELAELDEITYGQCLPEFADVQPGVQADTKVQEKDK